ncbi:MAG TPA: DMT family transporter [Solirubrobacteraceae bacterium]
MRTAAPRVSRPPAPEPAGFAPLDWALLGGAAGVWGASFLLIAIGVDHFEPGLVAFLRTAFGAATLAAFPGARRAIAREDRVKVAILGIVWMAVPFVLFSVAEQWIDSSLAGMLNAATPLFTAVVAAGVARSLPASRQAAGLVLGFCGVVAVTAPSVNGADADLLGAGLVLLAALLYGFAFNLTGPLQSRNGALPVIFRAQLVALVLLLPVGATGVPGSHFAWEAIAAVAVLGCFGTALAYVWASTLAGRVGGTRSSVITYFVPAVAIALGALARDETIPALAVVGTAMIVAGAYVTSRG